MTYKAKLYFMGLLLFSFGMAHADVSLPKIIRSDMVLQREQKVPIWGKASPGEKITVYFHHQTKTAVANAAGNWMVYLDKMTASNVPGDMIIRGWNKVVLKNILVGEVWLCSGQSNMEYTMRKNSKVVKGDNPGDSAVDELERAHNPDIRIFLVTQKNLLSQDSTHSGWSVAEDSALRSFSAVGYFFAKKLYSKLRVPIGVISSAVSGSAIEPWLPGAVSDNQPADKPVLLDTSHPGKFYPKMIEAVAPFAIKGFLWYQGETNCFQNESIEYAYKMQALIDGWRALWKNDNLPFYYVEIAPFYYSKSAGKYPLNAETEPKFWEAQTLIMKIPHTGMVVINDLPDSPDDLHPRGKWEVGRRLAQWALAKQYDFNVVPSGPMYKHMKIDNDKIALEFNYVGKGLESKDGKPLTWFTIAGADGRFVPAKAIIDGNKVIVSSPEVPHPKNVRFAWSEAAQPNFFNKDGLPAVPFRTDNPWHFSVTKEYIQK